MSHRYICSSGDEKSVISLLDDYLKGWVCSIIGIFCIKYITLVVMKLHHIPVCMHVSQYIYPSHVQNKLQPGTPKPRLFTVGRLDVATTGLIVVTNDGNFIILGRNYLGMNTLIIQYLKLAALLSGEFAQKVAHPSSNITKE
jgi:hypothetical protein